MAVGVVKQVAVRTLVSGDVLGTGETVVGIQPLLGFQSLTNPSFANSRRRVFLEKEDGSRRWTEWGASTLVSVVWLK
jgi:hypothetical protein